MKDNIVKWSARFALWELLALAITAFIGVGENNALVAQAPNVFYGNEIPLFEWGRFLWVNVCMAVTVVGFFALVVVIMFAHHGLDAFKEEIK